VEVGPRGEFVSRQLFREAANVERLPRELVVVVLRPLVRPGGSVCLKVIKVSIQNLSNRDLFWIASGLPLGFEFMELTLALFFVLRE